MGSNCLFFSITIWLFLLILTSAKPNDWTNHGGDLHNRRYAYGETKISPKTVANLRLKWKFVAGRDITATPTIYKNTIYFPSWNGNIYALNASNGSVIWQQNLQQLTGINTTRVSQGVNWTVSRATPSVADDILIVGIYGPAYILGLNITDGELVWSTQLDTHYAAFITMSGTYHKSAFYVGTSSGEEISSTIKTCCTFRGAFFKLNASNGIILWKTYMLPDNNGSTNKYAGAALWGSSPSIDINRNSVYIATGNLYSAPLNVTQCQEAQNNQTTPTAEDKCIEPDNHSNSVLALDLDSGRINWYRQLGGYDIWFFACSNLSTSGCPPGPSSDADFGEAPMILSVNDGKKRDIVALVQKSGIAWALDRDNGSIVWSTEAGPGGTAGGGTWGSATDGNAVYTNIANSLQSNFTLKPSNTTTTSGGWVSMDATTGNVLWSTGNPSNATASGPVSLANGVVFAGSTNGTGPIYAMSAATGTILWSYDTGATVYGGMSISNGCVYVGNGYKFSAGAINPSFTPGYTLFAFCVLP